MQQWKASDFATATPVGQHQVRGLVYGGIGLEPVFDDASGAWCEDWQVTHLATGVQVGTIVGLDRDEAMKLATLLAETVDWVAMLTLDELQALPLDVVSRLAILSDLSGGSLSFADLPEPMPRLTPKQKWAH